MSRTARRVGLALLGAGIAALAGFAAASPAAADNGPHVAVVGSIDRKSTRLNSSH